MWEKFKGWLSLFVNIFIKDIYSGKGIYVGINKFVLPEGN